jgi:hypothetical protein
MTMKTRWIALPFTFLAGVVVGSMLFSGPTPSVHAQSESASSQEKTVWYFYRVKWGHQDEFLDLYKKNHYPVIKAQLGDRVRGFKAYVPTYHGDGRADWTFASVMRFRDAVALTVPADEDAIARKLFPDMEQFHREERRRFEILDAHWDVPLTEVAME